MANLVTDKLPANSRPLYRILTEKSPLNFGKYGDLTLGDILKVDEEYCVWMYANMPNISFHQRILDALGLPKINKPGICPQVLYDWKEKREQQYTEEERLHGKFAKARWRKKEAVARLLEAKRKTTFTKGQLQAINHGRGGIAK